jgi:hypothetical protein
MPTQLPEHVRREAQRAAKLRASIVRPEFPMDIDSAVYLDSAGEYHICKRSAWTPPATPSFLPYWKPPYKPIAFVDPAGVVAYPEEPT